MGKRDKINPGMTAPQKMAVPHTKGEQLSLMTHFTQAIEQGPAAVVITDTQGNIEYVNPKFETLTGYSAEEVLGKNSSILKSGETPAQTYADMWDVIRKSEVWTGVFHNRKKNGELFWERAVISRVLDSDDNITHYVAVKEDITKQKMLEKKLEEQKLKLFHQSKMAEIGLLASSILHEVSNPIAAIRGMVSEIKETVEASPQCAATRQVCFYSSAYNHLVAILEHTDRLTDITHEISDFTSPNAGERELLDLNSVIRSSARLIRFDKRCQDITLTLDLDKQLPAVTGIKNQLSHLTLNLLINAADASTGLSDRHARVDVKTASIGDQVFMSVGDNGCGMTPEIQAHMFDAFFTTKHAGKGSGLGLSLCQSIIESHNGQLEIESEVDAGTTVRALIPINNDKVL